jgi:sulfate/thiosulfate transport system ATP-binding protein
VSIVARHVTKRFGAFTAVSDVSFEVGEGELVALLGPSGSGKSTVLRVIAGLDAPDGGEVFLTGETATHTPPRERNVGFVFQHYALFRHMTVWENVAFALVVRRRPKGEVRARVDELLRLVQLQGLERRMPSQLSGGQRQRVALARALAARPRVLLLDEPFGALDARVREELRNWLRRLHEEVHVTSLFVTHDQEEALAIADRIVMMNRGRVEQIGTAREVYEHPRTAFVASFLGPVNVLRGVARPGAIRFADGLEVETPDLAPSGEEAVYAYVRPHEIDVVRLRNGHRALPAVVHRLLTLGPRVKLEATLAGSTQTVSVSLSRERADELGLAEGEAVHLHLRDLKVFPDAADHYSI